MKNGHTDCGRVPIFLWLSVGLLAAEASLAVAEIHGQAVWLDR